MKCIRKSHLLLEKNTHTSSCENPATSLLVNQVTKNGSQQTGGNGGTGPRLWTGLMKVDSPGTSFFGEQKIEITITRCCLSFVGYTDVSKKKWCFFPQKWMVKMMVEKNPMNKWMIWGVFPIFFWFNTHMQFSLVDSL